MPAKSNNLKVLTDAISVALEKARAKKLNGFELTWHIVLSICELIGSEQFYLPNNTYGEACDRYAEIYDAFNGTNVAELAAKYQFTTRHIQWIIGVERKRRKKLRDADSCNTTEATPRNAESPKNARAVK